MSTSDLVLELKNTIKDLTLEKEHLHQAVSQKESRNKQILIRLENATKDVDHVGKHAAGVKQENEELKLKVATLKAKLETMEEVLKLAKEKIKDFEPDKEVELTDEDVSNIEESEEPELKSVLSEKYNKVDDEEE